MNGVSVVEFQSKLLVERSLESFDDGESSEEGGDEFSWAWVSVLTLVVSKSRFHSIEHSFQSF